MMNTNYRIDVGDRIKVEADAVLGSAETMATVVRPYVTYLVVVADDDPLKGEFIVSRNSPHRVMFM